MAESARGYVELPEDDPELFTILARYIFTMRVGCLNLRSNAMGLLGLANKYDVPSLHYICESYLCWKVQVRHRRFVARRAIRWCGRGTGG